MRLKKGDNVIMLGGKDRGKSGKILKVFPSQSKVVVEGLNLLKKGIKARKQGQKSQFILVERPVFGSSVILICKSCGKMTRVGFKLLSKGVKVRICKKCKAEI